MLTLKPFQCQQGRSTEQLRCRFRADQNRKGIAFPSDLGRFDDLFQSGSKVFQ